MEASGVDIVGQVVEEPVTVHGEGLGDELDVEAVEQLDEPGCPQLVDPHRGVVEDVGHV